ncbi:MAG: rhodanese-like domain-containing protein [Candidatus Yonathbacteria bacterium]|nr:rhodanese-like domain-containing protein [Candidatus Yonathbacteria bacterium]
MNNILPEEAYEIIDNGEAVVIDVRTPAEFDGGHISGARNIDINDSTFSEKIRALDTNASYVINCHLGGRSSKATAIMQELGFTNVKNLDGGITAWKKAGLPVNGPEGTK